jgi:hypothetical protein
MAIALRPPSEETLASLANEGPDVSLGYSLNREIASRAAITAMGAGTAWVTSRIIGSRERANTVALLALVGTQLGQTLISGGMSRPVVTTSVASAAVLAGIVQTPGLSQLFGCRPIGPVGWATALGASVGATAAAHKFPGIVDGVMSWLRLHQRVILAEPDVLPAPSPPALPSDSNGQ